MSETLIAKITMRTLGLDAKKHIPADGQPPIAIAQIYGVAQRIKIVEDKVRGDSFEAITGTFEAVNLETGEIYQSGVLYLPSGIHDMVATAIRNLDPDDKKAAIRFKLEIGVVKSTNAAGYSYEARSVVKASDVDPLADLRAAGGPPKLMQPAPAAPAASAPVAAGAPKPAQTSAAKPAQGGKK